MFPLAMGFGTPTEIAIIAGVVLLLFGGAKIADFGKSLGRGIKDFKQEVQDEDGTPALSPRQPTTASGEAKQKEQSEPVQTSGS